MDASSDHILTQQGEAEAKHSHCFASMMVYVQLRFRVDGKLKKIHTNKLMNSNWACIPLRLFYHKETDGKFWIFVQKKIFKKIGIFGDFTTLCT